MVAIASRSRLTLLIVVLLATIAVFLAFGTQKNFLRGSLIDDRVMVLADTDHDAKLSIREMRKVIVKMVMATVTGDLAYDLDVDGVTDLGDLRLLITSIRSYLSAVCGNGTVEAGEQCDDGNLSDRDSCSALCRSVVPIVGPLGYVADLSANTIEIFDLGRSPLPVRIGGTAAGSFPLSPFVQGHDLYVVNQGYRNLQIIDVSAPHTPTSVATARTGSNPISLSVQGSYAFVHNQNDNDIQIFDVHDPHAISAAIQQVSTGNGPRHMIIQDGYAYVANTDSHSLQIIDVTDPLHPATLSTVAAGGAWPSMVAIEGHILFVLCSNKLQLFDVSDPRSTVVLGSIPLDANPTALAIGIGYAYVTHSDSTLETIDVRDNQRLVSVSRVLTESSSRALSLYAGRLYSLNSGKTLQVFDLTDPVSPVSIGTAATDGIPSGMFIQDN